MALISHLTPICFQHHLIQLQKENLKIFSFFVSNSIFLGEYSENTAPYSEKKRALMKDPKYFETITLWHFL